MLPSTTKPPRFSCNSTMKKFFPRTSLRNGVPRPARSTSIFQPARRSASLPRLSLLGSLRLRAMMTPSRHLATDNTSRAVPGIVLGRFVGGDSFVRFHVPLILIEMLCIQAAVWICSILLYGFTMSRMRDFIVAFALLHSLWLCPKSVRHLSRIQTFSSKYCLPLNSPWVYSRLSLALTIWLKCQRPISQIDDYPHPLSLAV